MEARTLTVRMTGPLAGYAEGFAAELRSRRYAKTSTLQQLHLFSQLSRWLEQTGIEPAELTDPQVSSFSASGWRLHLRGRGQSGRWERCLPTSGGWEQRQSYRSRYRKARWRPFWRGIAATSFVSEG